MNLVSWDDSLLGKKKNIVNVTGRLITLWPVSVELKLTVVNCHQVAN